MLKKLTCSSSTLAAIGKASVARTIIVERTMVGDDVVVAQVEAIAEMVEARDRR